MKIEWEQRSMSDFERAEKEAKKMGFGFRLDTLLEKNIFILIGERKKNQRLLLSIKTINFSL